MKKLLLLALLGGSNLHLAAQITVTAGTFPATGDKLRYVQADNPNAAIGLFTPPGGNQFWDLSGLTAASTFETSYRPAAEGHYKVAFPGASMVVFSGTDEYYYKPAATKFELLGHAGSTVGGLPLNAVYLNQPSLAERHAPLNFFDIYQQSSNNFLKWGYNQIPFGAINLSVDPDSIRFRISTQVVEAVDGWGTLRLPGSLPQTEYQVLRLKKTTYREQRVDAKIPPLGWLDVTDNVVQSGSPWASLFGVDTITTHHYFNDLAKEEIAVLTFNTAQNTVVSLVYKNTALNTPIMEAPGAALPGLEVYPNPARATVTINCPAAPPGVYDLVIFNSFGICVKKSTQFLAGSSPIQLVLTPDMHGLYFCRLEDATGNIVGMSRLVVMP